VYEVQSKPYPVCNIFTMIPAFSTRNPSGQQNSPITNECKFMLGQSLYYSIGKFKVILIPP